MLHVGMRRAHQDRVGRERVGLRARIRCFTVRFVFIKVHTLNLIRSEKRHELDNRYGIIRAELLSVCYA
jgi:hypothetical protein